MTYPIILEIQPIESGTKDWVIGPSSQEIITWYFDEMGYEESDLLIEEVPEDQWESNYLTDPDIIYDEDLHEDNDEYNVIGTFASVAKAWTKGIELIASSEF